MNRVASTQDQSSCIAPYVNKLINTQQFAGVAWCVEHQGTVVEQGCAGFSDVQRQAMLQSDAIYRLYSMTKPVVSVACLQLIEAGLLRLSDPISHWIPAIGKQKVLHSDGRLLPLERPITVEDLLTHRAGYSYDFLPDCAVAEQYRQAQLVADGTRTLAELVQVLADCPLAWQPGTRWYYSYCTDVLAHVIECVCNATIGSCLHSSLFEPLGMGDTSFQVSPVNQHRLVSMYGQRELGLVPVITGHDNDLVAMNVDQSYPVNNEHFGRGGIGLYSTIDDYRAFMGVLMHGLSPTGEAMLSKPMLDMLWQNRLSVSQMPIDIGGNAYPGYGWGLTGRVMQDTGQAQFLTVNGEGGWAGAASTHFWVDRQNVFSGLVMAQYLGSNIPLGADVQALSYRLLS